MELKHFISQSLMWVSLFCQISGYAIAFSNMKVQWYLQYFLNFNYSCPQFPGSVGSPVFRPPSWQHLSGQPDVFIYSAFCARSFDSNNNCPLVKVSSWKLGHYKILNFIIHFTKQPSLRFMVTYLFQIVALAPNNFDRTSISCQLWWVSILLFC